MRSLVLAFLSIGSPSVALAQVVGDQTSSRCIDTAQADAAVLLEGRLTTATFTDTYHKEGAYILQLGQPICIDDGGEFADPNVHFSQVQLAAGAPSNWSDLRKSVGRNVKVSGKAFAAHTIHHHRPMVVIIDRLWIERR